MRFSEKPTASRRILCLLAALIMICTYTSITGTIAWFTDEVTSAGNVISTGNLKVELYHTNPTKTNEKVEKNVILFDAVSSGKWEPGAVAYENFTVKNAGTLALKYHLDLKVDQESVVNGHRLSEAIQYAIVPGGIQDISSRAAVIAAGENTARGWQSLAQRPLTQMTAELLTQTDDDIWGVILYWLPTADDNLFNMKNEYQGTILDMDVAVKLTAGQAAHERDAFGSTYDAEAPFEQALISQANSNGQFTISNEENTLLITGEANQGDVVMATIEETSADAAILALAADGQTLTSYDIEVKGQKPGTIVKVQLQMEPNLTDVAVFHENVKMQAAGAIPAADTFSYNESTGIITLYVNHFSTFSFVYTRPGRTTGIPATPPPVTPADDFIWTKTSEGIIITHYKGNAARVQVPETIDGAPVIRIGENAFAENKTLTHISLPESVTSIGKKAFYQCSNLESMSTY